ncbi:hypothetical protein H4R24_003339 [Coemansia sp. RSA 988]|nr:hypothetical protein H4R24_003339 [Coemansia sp. RSA 988]
MSRPTLDGLLHRSRLQPNIARASWYYKGWLSAYLISGLVALSLGAYYINGKDGEHRVFIVTGHSLRFFLFLGVYILGNAILGVIAALAPLKRRRLLYYYVGTIAVIIVIMLCVSIWLWTRTLNIHNYYGDMWRSEWTDDIKLMFEDKNMCCGYLSRNDSPVSSSAACKDTSIKHGCMYPVIFYAQRCHRFIYAGLIVFSIIGVGCIVTGMLLLIDCSEEDRVRLSQAHHLRKRAASKARDTRPPSSSSSTISTNAYQLNHLY